MGGWSRRPCRKRCDGDAVVLQRVDQAGRSMVDDWVHQGEGATQSVCGAVVFDAVTHHQRFAGVTPQRSRAMWKICGSGFATPTS